MSDKEKLNNIMNFITHITIYSGYGYDYKQAIRMLYNGADLNEVKEWYYTQVKGE